MASPAMVDISLDQIQTRSNNSDSVCLSLSDINAINIDEILPTSLTRGEIFSIESPSLIKRMRFIHEHTYFADAWEVCNMIIAIESTVLYVVSTYIYSSDNFGDSLKWYFGLDTANSAFFCIDWILEFFLSRSLLVFFTSFSCWIDMATILPAFSYLLSMVTSPVTARSITAFLRPLRVFRVARAMQAFKRIRFFEDVAKNGIIQIVILVIASLLGIAGCVHAYSEVWPDSFHISTDSSPTCLIPTAVSPKNDVPKLSFLQALYFTIITLSTVGYGDITPNSNGIITLIVIIAVPIFIVLVPVIANTIWDLLKSRDPLFVKRYKPLPGVEFILLTGVWSDLHLVSYVKSIMRGAFVERDLQVVVMVAEPLSDFPHFMRMTTSPIYSGKIVFLRGSPFNKHDVIRVSGNLAKAIAITNGENLDTYSDSSVFLTAMCIRRFCSKPRIVAILYGGTSLDVIDDFMNVEGLSLSRIRNAMVQKAVMCPGSQVLLSNLCRHDYLQLADLGQCTPEWKKLYYTGCVQELSEFKWPNNLAGVCVAEAATILLSKLYISLVGITQVTEKGDDSDVKCKSLFLVNPDSNIILKGGETVIVICADPWHSFFAVSYLNYLSVVVDDSASKNSNITEFMLKENENDLQDRIAIIMNGLTINTALRQCHGISSHFWRPLIDLYLHKSDGPYIIVFRRRNVSNWLPLEKKLKNALLSIGINKYDDLVVSGKEVSEACKTNSVTSGFTRISHVDHSRMGQRRDGPSALCGSLASLRKTEGHLLLIGDVHVSLGIVANLLQECNDVHGKTFRSIILTDAEHATGIDDFVIDTAKRLDTLIIAGSPLTEHDLKVAEVHNATRIIVLMFHHRQLSAPDAETIMIMCTCRRMNPTASILIEIKEPSSASMTGFIVPLMISANTSSCFEDVRSSSSLDNRSFSGLNSFFDIDDGVSMDDDVTCAWLGSGSYIIPSMWRMFVILQTLSPKAVEVILNLLSCSSTNAQSHISKELACPADNTIISILIPNIFCAPMDVCNSYCETDLDRNMISGSSCNDHTLSEEWWRGLFDHLNQKKCVTSLLDESLVGTYGYMYSRLVSVGLSPLGLRRRPCLLGAPGRITITNPAPSTWLMPGDKVFVCVAKSAVPMIWTISEERRWDLLFNT